tara:strand:+ start:165 stop:365 length:201 start_codon:yes stop_codon:yes gene_type:complete
MSTITQAGKIDKMEFHKETCLRCDGTGRVWFSSFLAGVCFGCKGKGQVLLKKSVWLKKPKLGLNYL